MCFSSKRASQANPDPEYFAYNDWVRELTPRMKNAMQIRLSAIGVGTHTVLFCASLQRVPTVVSNMNIFSYSDAIFIQNFVQEVEF